jgi:hypothetical protein
VQCSALQCSAVQCSAVQCSAVQCSAVQCSAVERARKLRSQGHEPQAFLMDSFTSRPGGHLADWSGVNYSSSWSDLLRIIADRDLSDPPRTTCVTRCRWQLVAGGGRQRQSAPRTCRSLPTLPGPGRHIKCRLAHSALLERSVNTMRKLAGGNAPQVQQGPGPVWCPPAGAAAGPGFPGLEPCVGLAYSNALHCTALRSCTINT